jgi:hypothetical protein
MVSCFQQDMTLKFAGQQVSWTGLDNTKLKIRFLNLIRFKVMAFEPRRYVNE